MMPTAAASTLPKATRCRNCRAVATGNFCPDCGQETRVALPTAREFLREAAGRLVAIDGRLWRTIFALVLRPGFLTREYLSGRRRRYVRPARLFVLLSLLAFAVIGFVRSPAFFADEVIVTGDKSGAAPGKNAAVSPEAAEPSAAVSADDADVPSTAHAKSAAKVKSGGRDNFIALEFGGRDNFIALDENLNLQIRFNGVAQQLPPELRQRYQRFKRMNKEDRVDHLYAGMLRYGPTMVVLMLPIFAFLLQLAYLGRGKRYPGRPQRYAEHLVYSAHLHAFAALMVILLALLPFGWAPAAIVAWSIYYVLRAGNLVYGGRRWAAVLRTLVTGLAYTIVGAIAVAGLVIAATMMR
jgi:hypothetical protein